MVKCIWYADQLGVGFASQLGVCYASQLGVRWPDDPWTTLGRPSDDPRTTLRRPSEDPRTSLGRLSDDPRTKQIVSQTIDLVMTIQTVQKSSKSELSSRFLSTSKFLQFYAKRKT